MKHRLRVLKLFSFVIIGLSAILVADMGQAIGENFLVPQEDQMRGMVNQTRSSRGLSALPNNDGLRWMARRQAQAMAAAGYIFHTSNLAGSADQQSLPWLSLGENVGKGPSVEHVQQSFMSSPGHLSNIVNPGFNALGVGATADAQEALYFTQSFAALQASAPASTSTQPAPAAPAPRAGGGGGEGQTGGPASATAPPTPQPTPEPTPEPPITAESLGLEQIDIVGHTGSVPPAAQEGSVSGKEMPEQPSILDIVVTLLGRFLTKLAFWN